VFWLDSPWTGWDLNIGWGVGGVGGVVSVRV
jgi:hypothetical protein